MEEGERQMNEDGVERSFRGVVLSEGVVDGGSGRGGEESEDERSPVKSSVSRRTKGKVNLADQPHREPQGRGNHRTSSGGSCKCGQRSN